MLQAIISFLAILLYNSAIRADEKVVYIYQDADLSHHTESSKAIQKGIRLAFDEIGNEINGYQVRFKFLDHRGNVIRSKQNYQTFIDDSKALTIYSGAHSPPLIKNRDFINKNKALTLVPWAAGGPITRHPSPENWVFRLSIDDTQAGSVIIDFSMKDKQCKAPHLLLEQTPWGDSNLKSMSKALQVHGIVKPAVTRFAWNTSPQTARSLLRHIVNAGADCLILVANAIEGGVFAQALMGMEMAKTLPIISHWGITGGNFHEVINAQKRKNLDLHFIQSCFAFTNSKQPVFAQKVFKQLQQFGGGEIKKASDLPAVVGFIHAYDLTRLLIAAIQQAGLSGDIQKDRNTVRLALEHLKVPVQGLVKRYETPFSVFDAQTNPNAHEALHREHYCMGRYAEDDSIIIVQ